MVSKSTQNKARTSVPMLGRARYRPRGGELSRVSGVLSRALKRYGLDRSFERYEFVLHWKEIVGEEVSKRTRPECLRNKALIVRVGGSAWAQELSFHKDEILKRLRQFLPPDVEVNDVRFVVGNSV